jgi:hypothetical protein
MGLFSALGKALGGIWDGIKKIFAPIMKPIAKLLNSKLGKVLMLAVSVFSMGSALLAGGKGFLAGEGFIGKFINGGKEFLNSLLGTKLDTTAPPGVDAAGAVAEGVGEVVPGAVQAGDVLTGANAATSQVGAGGIAEAVPAAGQAPIVGAGGRTGAAEMAATGGEVTEAGGNWLTKAMSAAKDFAKSETGGTIIGNVLQGYGRGQEMQAYLDEKSRVSRMFEDPNDPGMRMLREHDYSVGVPRGLAAAPGRLAQAEAERSGRYAPTVPFRRPPVPVGG